jgi:hypothetical protein
MLQVYMASALHTELRTSTFVNNTLYQSIAVASIGNPVITACNFSRLCHTKIHPFDPVL